MTSEQWRRLNEIFDAAIRLPAAERSVFVQTSCPGDPALADAALRLLTAHERPGFLETPAIQIAHDLLEEPGGPATIGRYRIVRRLGCGGMGLVYLAQDSRLGRSVALKLLPGYLSADPAAAQRLTAEARAASALDHPNIETIYEIGETEDDRLFIAMAYYEGETLRDRIATGPLAIPDSLDLCIQLAEGLKAAHGSGIIHRDVKPENLMITRDGTLKIVDFGVAKIVEKNVISEGLPLGTPVYMSPEQTRGQSVDHRTDIWSTGVVLYEMLAGSRPYGGEGSALIHAIRHEPPPSLPSLRRGLPPGLVAIVERCLEKEPERRFESAGDLALALGAVRGGASTVSSVGRAALPAPRARQRRRQLIAGAGLVVAVLSMILLQSDTAVSPPPSGKTLAPGIAILPFQVHGEELEVWREGMVDLLSVGLDGAADLRAIDSRTVLARWKELAGAGEADLATSLRVARAAGARYAILGSVVPVGDDLRLVADVYEVERAQRLGQPQVEGSRGEILGLVDRLAIETLGVIFERDHGLPDIDVASLTSTSLPAVREYLNGEVRFRQGEYSEAIAAYDRAIAADSTFSLAWFGLGTALGWLEAADNPRGPDALVRALRDPVLPERYALLARAYLLDSTVVEPLRAAIRRHPDDARMWFALGDIYFHQSEIVLAGPREAAAAFRRAVELDPGFAPSWVHFINLAFFVDPDSARIGRAIEAYGRVSSDVRGHQLAHALAFGDPDSRARASFEELDSEVLFNAYLNLLHPRYYDVVFPLLEALVRKAPPHWKSAALATLGRHNLWAGRVERGMASLFDPRVEDNPWYMYCVPYGAFARGLPVPASQIEARFSTAVIDSTSDIWVGCIGAWTADRGRWEDHRQVRRAIRDLGGHRHSVGDTTGFKQFDAIDRALEGYVAWKRGNRVEALRLLDAARPSLASSTSSEAALPHSWWTGQILLELGRPIEAASHFRAQWLDPLANYELAKIYDQLGEDAKARAEYEVFIDGWRNADPELKPLVERAQKSAAQP